MRTQFQMSPGNMPAPLKKLILAICISTLAAGLLEVLFVTAFKIPGPQTFLTLSTLTFSHFFLWQPFTYLFVHGGPHQGIHFGLLIELAFHIYIIWAMGSTVLERIGTKSFFKLFFITGIGAGILTVLAMALFSSHAFVGGCTPAILALLYIWTAFFPEATIMLFLIIPIRAKWLMGGLIGAILLVHLSDGNFVSLINDLGGIGIAYFYGLLLWELRSPFEFTHKFDSKAIQYGIALRYKYEKRFASVRSSKIFDIKTGKGAKSDEAFMDAMLDKIAKDGEKSLSWWQKRRMANISKRRK